MMDANDLEKIRKNTINRKNNIISKERNQIKLFKMFTKVLKEYLRQTKF